MIQILAIYPYFEDAKNIQSFKFSYGALVDIGGSWLGFSINFSARARASVCASVIDFGSLFS